MVKKNETAKAGKATVTKTEKFLLASPKVDTIRTSAIARKVDGKDKDENASRFLAMNTRETSALLTFVESFKARLFADVFATFGAKVGKDFIVEVFTETDLLDAMPCIAKAHKSLSAKNNETVSDAAFLTALKMCMTNHVSRIAPTKEKALANLSVKAREVFGTGTTKADFIALITPKPEKEKTPRRRSAIAGSSATMETTSAPVAPVA